MLLSGEILDRARAGDPAACEAVLSASFPSIVRISIAITGDAQSGDRVARQVLTQGARQLRRWSRASMPENWFYHHTLLIAREIAATVTPRDEPLVTADTPADPEYLAFIRTLRGLPPQQREAFILHHGERLNARHLGVAMDCSANAALNHLAAATAAVTTIAGHSMVRLTSSLSRHYRKLSPAPDTIRACVERFVPIYARPLRRRRWARLVIALIILIAVTAAGLKWRLPLQTSAEPWVAKLRAMIGW